MIDGRKLLCYNKRMIEKRVIAFDIGSKRAFLCVINNKKNMEWVRTFWDKPIEDIGDLREILFKKKKIQ